MSDRDEPYESIKEADRREQPGFTRYLCELYLKENPDHGPTLLRYAANLIALGQFALAKGALDHAMKVMPPGHQQFVLLRGGWLCQAQGDYAGALEMFSHAHDLAPDDATYLVYAAEAAFHKGQVDQAAVLARQATKCPKGNIEEAHVKLGTYLVAKKKYREAATSYLKALKLNPAYGEAKARLRDIELIFEHQGQPVPKLADTTDKIDLRAVRAKSEA